MDDQHRQRQLAYVPAKIIAQPHSMAGEDSIKFYLQSASMVGLSIEIVEAEKYRHLELSR